MAIACNCKQAACFLCLNTEHRKHCSSKKQMADLSLRVDQLQAFNDAITNILYNRLRSAIKQNVSIDLC